MTPFLLDDGPRALYDRATFLFADRAYIDAVPLLRELLDAEPGNLEVRLLLARAYYHSAQLGRAERELRALVETDPTDAYAQLMLGRVLQRQSRHDEAVGPLRLSAAMDPSLDAERFLSDG